MHIPENYLSPATCGVLTAAMVPVWTYSIKKVSKTITKEKMPLLGIGAAFSFLGMMFNVPLPGGTTGHAVGGTLIALLLGPEAACLSVSVALILQALLFGDGGILAIGANCFNMAFVLPFVGYYLYQLIKKLTGGEKHFAADLISAAIGAFAGINAAAFFAAVEFGIQPLLFTDANGQALYCPYGLSVAIPAMMVGHLTIFGLAEVIFTVAIFAYVKKVSPGTIYEDQKEKRIPIYGLVAALVALTPLGTLAAGTAWGEWGADEIAETVANGVALGYTPEKLLSGFEWSAIFPDYEMAGLPGWFGYILCAVIGVALSVILFKLISLVMKKKVEA